MNGVMVPEYWHADLLHPARRLWRRLLPDCSQSTIEVSVLGLDRAGDVSGAMAPDIWFSFLKTQNNRELLSICDHNVRDITGLASIFLTLGEISSDPIGSKKRFVLDEEALALSYRKALKKNPDFFVNTATARNGSADDMFPCYTKTEDLLLESAAQNGSLRAAISMAINAEWRLKDINAALKYTDLALTCADISGDCRDSLEKRRSRLITKMVKNEKKSN